MGPPRAAPPSARSGRGRAACGGGVHPDESEPGRTRRVAAIDHLAVSPDGRTLALGGGVRSYTDEPGHGVRVTLCDVTNGEITRTLVGHTEPVQRLAFSPDGGAPARRPGTARSGCGTSAPVRRPAG